MIYQYTDILIYHVTSRFDFPTCLNSSLTSPSKYCEWCAVMSPMHTHDIFPRPSGGYIVYTRCIYLHPTKINCKNLFQRFFITLKLEMDGWNGILGLNSKKNIQLPIKLSYIICQLVMLILLMLVILVPVKFGRVEECRGRRGCAVLHDVAARAAVVPGCGGS